MEYGCTRLPHATRYWCMRSLLFQIGVVVIILGVSAIITNVFARAMYIHCANCGTLNARRRTACRKCGTPLKTLASDE